MKYAVLIFSCVLVGLFIAYQSGAFTSDKEDEILANPDPIAISDTSAIVPDTAEPEPDPVILPSSKVVIMRPLEELEKEKDYTTLDRFKRPGSIFGPATDSTSE